MQNGKPRSGPLFEAMRKTRSKFKHTLRQCHKDKERIRADIMANRFLGKSSKDFWKEIKKVNGKGPCISNNINNVSGEKRIADLWGEHYQKLLNLHKMVPMQFDNHVQKESVQLSVNEVFDNICKMKKGISPGCDGISAEHFIYAHCSIACVVTLLLNACIMHQFLPSGIMKTIIVPIVKDSKEDITSQDNYRPIAIATVLSKIIESVFRAKYDDLLETCDNQFGFKKKHSTDMAIFAFKNIIEYYVSNNSPVYVCFLDASKAFDRVNHGILLGKLTSRNVPIVIVNLLKF